MPRKPIKFDLDFMKKDIFSRFTVKQFDDVTFTITPKINNDPYDITGMTGVIYVGVNNEMFMQDTNITVSSNSIVVTLDKNMLSKDGRAYAEIELTDSTGTVTSSSFIFDIDRKIGEGATIPGQIDGFIAKYEKLITEFKSQVNNAILDSENRTTDVLDSFDTESNKKLNDIETRFQTLTTSQQQDAEVIEARKGEASLKAKMDKIDEQFNTNVRQIDSNTYSINNIQTQINTIANGSPKGVYPTLVALQQAFPNGNSNIYVVSEDGGWYYWSSGGWTKGGSYQSSLIANDTLNKSNNAYKKNLVSNDIRFWQLGNDVNETTSYAIYNSFLNARLTLNPKYHVYFNAEKKYTVKFASTNFRIAINELDANNTQQFDSGWLTPNKNYIFTKKTSSIKINVVVSKNDNSLFDIRDCLKDLDITLCFGESLQNVDINDIQTSFNTQDYLDNLTDAIELKQDLFKQGNLTWSRVDGSASFDGDIYRVAYLGLIDVTDKKYLYLNGSIFDDLDVYVKLINKTNNDNNSVGWVTSPQKIELPPYSDKVMFCFKFKDNSRIFPYFIDNFDFYIGYVPRKTDNKKNFINSTSDFLKDVSIKNVAHRGYSSIAPENSYPAFVEAGKNEFWGIETDLQETKDGKIILCHDETLDRTTNGTGAIINYTFDELRQLKIDFGVNIDKYSDLKLPSLEEYLLVCKKYNCIPVMEIKTMSDETVDYLINVLNKYQMIEKCIIISYDISRLSYIRSKDKNIHIQPLKDLSLTNIRTIMSLGNASINSGVSVATELNVDLAHSYGVLVQVNTPNTEALHKQCIRNGVDMLASDYIFDYDFTIY